jgi:selenide,water dikinase
MLEGLPRNVDPNLLVGFETRDDSAVYRVTDELALVSTADIITPPVDDPRVFGRIAAANALSDIYAMGARPIVALNLAGFPQKVLDVSVLGDIVAGALEKITEAGAVLAGGHTTDDEEPKFGLAVTGLVHPGRYWSNAGARPGDALILTKPLGSGVLFNANLKGRVSAAAMERCIETLTTLNKAAAEVLAALPADAAPHAVTDVTGFGLAGHALEMAEASGVTIEIDTAALPIFDEAIEMYEKGVSTGVNRANWDMIEGKARMEHGLSGRAAEILVDPQTSGGLLVAVGTEVAEDVVRELREVGVTQAVRIGTVGTNEQGFRLRFV